MAKTYYLAVVAGEGEKRLTLATTIFKGTKAEACKRADAITQVFNLLVPNAITMLVEEDTSYGNCGVLMTNVFGDYKREEVNEAFYQWDSLR